MITALRRALAAGAADVASRCRRNLMRRRCFPVLPPLPPPRSVPLVTFIVYALLAASKPTFANAPPIWRGGLPFVGHFKRFSANPVGVIREGYDKCGNCFTMEFLGNRLTFMLGPDAHAPFFRANDEELSQNEPYKFMTPIFGPGIVFDAPLHIKNQQLRFMSGALKTASLKTYVPKIIAEADAFFNSQWGDEGEIDLLDAMARLTILTASRCLLGKEVRETLFESVTKLLHDLDEGISPLAIFFPNAPLPAFR
jgi:sterol 14-demethylase